MKRLFTLVAGLAGAAVLYDGFLRRPILNFGARPDEVERVLPGDELLEDADVVATRAITIVAPPAAIWPWIVQMGPGRGGAYTYDWIENLFGLNMHSAAAIVPEWQDMHVGDEWHNPQGGTMRVELLEPERTLVMRAGDGSWIWTFAIVPEGAQTRFLSRNRFLVSGGPLQRLASEFLMEPGSLLMEHKMLTGIKSRAEHLAQERREGRVRIGEPLAAPAPA